MPTDPNTITTPGAVPPSTPAGEPKPGALAADEQEKQTSGWRAAEQFKAEAAQAKKDLDVLKAHLAKKDTDEAAKRGEFEKLWTEEKSKREAAEGKLARVTKRSAIVIEAGKHGGLVDADALRMFDLEALELGADGESVKGVAEFVKAAAEAKPYLFGTKSGKEPFPTPKGNPGGADNFDPRKVTSEDIRAGKVTPDQMKQVAALRTGSAPPVDMFGRPIAR